MAVDHQGLVALEPETVAGAHRLHPCHQGAMLCPFVDRERGKQRAICDFRQMLGFLRGAAAAGQRGSCEHGGCKKRRRPQHAPHFPPPPPPLPPTHPPPPHFSPPP